MFMTSMAMSPSGFSAVQSYMIPPPAPGPPPATSRPGATVTPRRCWPTARCSSRGVRRHHGYSAKRGIV